MDQGLPPPSPLAGPQQLGYYNCLQCRRLKFKPLNILIQIWNFNSHLTAQPPDAALPVKVSILQPFPLKLFYFLYTFEYSLDEKLEGDAPTFCIST